MLLEVGGNILLFLLVFSMSATVDTKSLYQQLRNKNAILLGAFCQFILLPLLGFATVNIFNLDAPLGITLLVVTSSPGGSYSNWWCSMFNADLALSVTMTAISTLLSIFTLPANLLLYAKFSYAADVTKDLDWTALFISLGIVISAITLGLYFSYKIHSYRFNVYANKCGNISGLALIIFSALVTNVGDAESRIWNRDWQFYVSCIFPCILGLVLSSVLASVLKLKKPERMTVAVECCYQNVGIATSLALTMFNGKDLNEAMGVPFFYGLVEAVFVGLYCFAGWKAGWTKAPSNVSFWKMILVSYEVLDAEYHDIREIEVAFSQNQKEEFQTGQIFTTFFSMEEVDLDRAKRPSGELDQLEIDAGALF